MINVKNTRFEFEINPGESFFFGVKDEKGVDKGSVYYEWSQLTLLEQVNLSQIEELLLSMVDDVRQLFLAESSEQGPIQIGRVINHG